MGRAWTGITFAVVLLGAAYIPSMGQETAPALKGKLGAKVSLFNGKDLAGWNWHSATAESKITDVWMVKEGILHCAIKPTGFIDTEKEYRNFVLTVEERHVTKGNGGLFICINGEEKIWPNSIQIQGNFGKVGDLLNQNTGMKKMMTDPARTAVSNKDVVITRMHPETEKPLGEWNTVVITMEEGNLTVVLNGVVVNKATEVSPEGGKIGIQAEGGEMEFRKVELLPLESASH